MPLFWVLDAQPLLIRCGILLWQSYRHIWQDSAHCLLSFWRLVAWHDWQ